MSILISAHVPPVLVKDIDKFRRGFEEEELSRSKAIRMLLRSGLEARQRKQVSTPAAA
jgi:metal-responsive CopG/Arc/MetJ family transcriptional regulator